MLSIGRIFAGDGWRYLWEQVGTGRDDYYLADVARGERPGAWTGSAAGSELGLAGEVTKEQMHRLFGLLVHPTEPVGLGRPPRIYRSLEQRLAAAGDAHHEHQAELWMGRAVELAESRAPAEQIDVEHRAHLARAAESWAEREAAIRRGGDRQAVAGFDLTFSPPKSVSVLWAAADAKGRKLIWRAHHEGVQAALAYLEREAAWSRAGYNGIRQIDTSGWVIAGFDHRMSRAGDVQIHTHCAVLNRVRCADGEWRSADSRALYRAAASAGAIYDRVREAALERDLGVSHEVRKPGGPREIAGVDEQTCRLFSTRRTQIEGRLAELVDAYRGAHPGVEPSAWTISRLGQWATLQTRQAKERHESTAAALSRWEAESRAQLGRSLRHVWERAVPRDRLAHGRVRRSSGHVGCGDDQLIAAAVAAVDAERSTWTRFDLARRLTNSLPLDAGMDAGCIQRRVDRLVGYALGEGVERFGIVDLSTPPVFDTPAELVRSTDATSSYLEHGAIRYTTKTGLAQEDAVLAAAGSGDGPTVDADLTEPVINQAGLGADQTEAVRRLAASGRRIEALIGPAGTGKTTTMAALAEAWRASGRAVIGLAVSETATRVLSREAAIRAVNTAKLLHEHNHREADVRQQQWWRSAYAIPAGSLVILDEASMASRSQVDQLARICAASRSKLVLVGDHEQLASPAAGGLLRLVVDRAGAVELAEIHRFNHPWEQPASLGLRAANPDVLSEYDLRGRIHAGSETDMEDAAFAAALADRARGVRTLLLADTNQTAARLAARFRAELVAAGVVDDSRTVELADGNRAGRGDRIVTRHNNRANRSAAGAFVANRDTWQITEILGTRAVRVCRVDPDTDQPLGGDTTVLEGTYVAEQVQLAYAGTVHAAQGATGATTHAIVSANTSRAGLYVALTRGRDENHAYVICSRPEGADRDGPTQHPQAILAAIIERDDDPTDHAARAVQTEQAEAARSLATLFPIWQDLISIAGRARSAQAITGALGAHLAEPVLSSPAWPTLAARLRTLDAAGMNSAALLAAVAHARPLDDADDPAAVLHWRLAGAEHNARLVLDDTFAQLSANTTEGDLGRAIHQVAAAMDARINQLGHHIQTTRPAWAAQLGPLPDNADKRVDWRRRAGIVAGYQQAFNIETDGTDPIGDRPGPMRPDAHSWWQRAAAALERTEPATLARLPDEHLEAIIDQARQAETAAPPPIAEGLHQAHVQLRQARTAEGLARQTGDHTTADTAAEQVRRLAEAVLQAEDHHRRRQQWRTHHARLLDQAEAARTELDLRAAGRAATRHADIGLDGLHRQAAHAKTRLDSMEETLQHLETLDRRYARRLARLNTQIADLTASRPATTSAHARINNEQHVAGRIDQLQQLLAKRRPLTGIMRADQRAAHREELHQLRDTHPQLVAPDRRQQHWQQILRQAETQDARHIDALHGQLDQVQARRQENTQIIEACQAERHNRANLYHHLNDAIATRNHVAGQHPGHPAKPPETTGAIQPNPHLCREPELAPPDIEPPAPSGPSITP